MPILSESLRPTLLHLEPISSLVNGPLTEAHFRETKRLGTPADQTTTFSEVGMPLF